MKRSEMVRIIEDAIDDSIDYDPEFGQTISAGGILRAIEEAGMLPPTVELSACGSLMPTNELLNYSEIDYELKWEKEDEE